MTKFRRWRNYRVPRQFVGFHRQLVPMKRRNMGFEAHFSPYMPKATSEAYPIFFLENRYPPHNKYYPNQTCLLRNHIKTIEIEISKV